MNPFVEGFVTDKHGVLLSQLRLLSWSIYL